MISKPNKFIKKYGGSVLVVFAVLLLWEIIARTHHQILALVWNLFTLPKPVPDWTFLSSPYAVVRSLPSELVSGSLLFAFLGTVYHCLLAFIIAAAAGLLLSRLLLMSAQTQRAILPLLNALSGIPPVALFPLLLVAFKLGSGSVVALAVLGAVVSVALISYDAQVKLTHDFGLMISKLGYSKIGRWLWELSLASNGLFTAAREGIRWSLILSVVGEMHGSVAGGIGAYVDSGRLNQNYALVYVGVISCALLSLFLKIVLDAVAIVLHKIVKGLLLSPEINFRAA